MPALHSVQDDEVIVSESFGMIMHALFTEFPTDMLKSVPLPRVKKAAPLGRLPSSLKTLPGNFLQQLLIDIEIRVDILHIIVFFERFHQPDHRRRR